MSNRCSTLTTLATIATLLCNLPCDSVAADWQFSAGGGVVYQRGAWKGIPVQSTPVPFFTASDGRWTLGTGPDSVLSYRLLASDSLRADVGIGIRDAGYNPSTALQSLTSADPVFNGYQAPRAEVVGQLALHWHWFSLQLAPQLNESQQDLVTTASISIPLWPFAAGGGLNLHLQQQWLDQDFSQRIYGVNEQNQDLAAGRPGFSPPAARNLSAGLQLEYPLASQISLQAAVSHSRLAASLRASPLLDSASTTEGWLLLVYRF